MGLIGTMINCRWFSTKVRGNSSAAVTSRKTKRPSCGRASATTQVAPAGGGSPHSFVGFWDDICHVWRCFKKPTSKFGPLVMFFWVFACLLITFCSKNMQVEDSPCSTSSCDFLAQRPTNAVVRTACRWYRFLVKNTCWTWKELNT